MRRKVALALTVILPLFSSGVAVADLLHGAEEIDAALLRVMEGRTFDDFVARLLWPLKVVDKADMLTAADVDRYERRVHARIRAGYIASGLAKDLDGDGRISSAEFEATRSDDRDSIEPRRPEELPSAADIDGNGEATYAELLQWAEARPKRRDDTLERLSLLMRLDADGDGVATVAEIEAHARRVFARFDANGDGVLDNQSLAAAKKAARDRKPKRASSRMR